MGGSGGRLIELHPGRMVVFMVMESALWGMLYVAFWLTLWAMSGWDEPME